VTHLRCGGIFNDSFIANFLPIVIVKEFQKSASIWWSYAWNTPDSFFPDTVYIKTFWCQKWNVTCIYIDLKTAIYTANYRIRITAYGLSGRSNFVSLENWQPVFLQINIIDWLILVTIDLTAKQSIKSSSLRDVEGRSPLFTNTTQRHQLGNVTWSQLVHWLL